MMKLWRMMFGCVLAAGTVVILPPAAQAARAPSPEAEARKQINEAKRNVDRLKATLNRKRLKLRTALEARADYKAALAERTKAATAFAAASRPAMTSLRGTPEYREARVSREKIKTQLAELKGGGTNGLVRFQVLTADLKRADDNLRQIEAGAVVSDDKASQAKVALDEAQAKLDALNAEVDAALAADPEYVAAQSGLASAEASHVAAKANLVAVARAQRQAKAAARQQRSLAARQTRVRSGSS